MRFVRVIHQDHYDSRLGRFQSLAFRPSSSNGGVSVFEYDCAIATSSKICNHINIFYPHVSGQPPIYWVFDASALPEDHDIETSPSDRNDACHRDIKLSKKLAEKFFKQHASFPDSFRICLTVGESRELSLDDLRPDSTQK